MATTDFGGTFRHADLADLGVGDPHPQYAALLVGALAARPDAGVGRDYRFYLALDGGGTGVPVLYVDAGTTWATTVAPVDLAPLTARIAAEETARAATDAAVADLNAYGLMGTI